MRLAGGAPPFADAEIARPASQPSVFEWFVAVFALIVQQGAFISIPLYFGKDTVLIRQDTNNLNTLAVAISLASVMFVCLWRLRPLARLAQRNPLSIAFLLLVIASTLWSIHPDLTIRRGAGYFLTLLVAAYLAVRFEPLAQMKALSASFAISALGSLAFIAIFPRDGIMHVAELTGAWRGVFPHKSVLGTTMAVAAFVELFILVSGRRSSGLRFGLLGIFLALIVLSHSATGFILAAFYLAAAGSYYLARRSPALGAFVAVAMGTAVVAAACILIISPDILLGLMGKDETLTGRTNVWSFVVSLIEQRPLLGYGYRAAWVLNDAATVQADQMTGGWGVGELHNSYLELVLQMGYVGAAVIGALVISGFVRAAKCWRTSEEQLGFFTLIYICGMLFASFVIEILGLNQVLEWLMFNLLIFACSEAIAKRGAFNLRNASNAFATTSSRASIG